MKTNPFSLLLFIFLALCLSSLTFGQEKFKVSIECMNSCDRPLPASLISFDYRSGLEISVTAGPTDPRIIVTKDKHSTSMEFVISDDSMHYIKKDTRKPVDSTLESILSKVNNLGLHCYVKKISGGYSESGAFQVLADLRKSLGIVVQTRPQGRAKRIQTTPKKGR